MQQRGDKRWSSPLPLRSLLLTLIHTSQSEVLREVRTGVDVVQLTFWLGDDQVVVQISPIGVLDLFMILTETLGRRGGTGMSAAH